VLNNLSFNFILLGIDFQDMQEQIIGLANDDKNSFKIIFRKLYQPLCYLSLQYLADEDEAKEVVQGAFLKLWETRHELSHESNLRNFLFTIVKNNCLNILKHRQILLKHHNEIRSLELHYQYESLSRMDFDSMEIDELKEKIDAAIRNLPEHCRVVFEMSRYEDLKNREIAEKLGVTQKTIEAHLTKALKILRNDLIDYLPLILAFTKIIN
jgi:RNA polymerase sigma-70 factor (ECF subfamily)